MKCLVGIDDTDSSSGYCTTYLGYKIARDLATDLEVVPYPRLVRLNPNIPFKTRGNAAVCLEIETDDPERAFRLVTDLFSRLSDVKGGANSGLVFLEDMTLLPRFESLYHDALTGLVNRHRAERLLRESEVKFENLGNGMGLVGAAASLAFDERFDHTYELIAYRKGESWGTPRSLDATSVMEMDRATFPHTFNNYDHQKRKVLLTPHGPDPVFLGIRGDSPRTVLDAFRSLRFDEELDGHMVWVSNQYTDSHIDHPSDWKVFSSGWAHGAVLAVEVGAGGHVYASIMSEGVERRCAFYEPTGDLRRAAARLMPGDVVKVFGGVRRGTISHPKILNAEKLEVIRLNKKSGGLALQPGVYVSSPRANRHLTKPLIRNGHEVAGRPSEPAGDWLGGPVTLTQALARSR